MQLVTPPECLCDILDKAANTLDKAISDNQGGSQEWQAN